MSCGSRREAGTPAIMPFAASASTTGAAGLGSLIVNSLKKAGVTTSTPGSLRQPVGQRARLGVIDPRQPRQPFLAQQRQMDGEGQGAEPGIGADVAGRLLAADMLLAGRQASAHSRAGRRHPPSRRTAGPASGAGISRGWRTGRHRVRRNSGHCRCDWPSAATMSAPCAPGGSEQAQRDDFRHHRDQQRALGMGGLGDGLAGCGSGRTRPGSAPRRRRSRSSIRAMRSSALPGVTGARATCARAGRPRSRPSRHNGDAGRRTGSPCRAW